jgi:predicted nuclease with TOPRIM domain
MEAQESEQVRDLKAAVKRRDVWMERMKCDYNELAAERDNLQEENERLTKELNSALGDVAKLQARVAELEAQITPPGKTIILP